ncbi:hypothetical protein BaRGS_00032831 [Batillaria attramentaria]|uniref:Uncharacterized protein n=1 Tax=Batillaria attramentaria TaxID=370345 RepID=A0ABD0JLT5_9CAEN
MNSCANFLPPSLRLAKVPSETRKKQNQCLGEGAGLTAPSGKFPPKGRELLTRIVPRKRTPNTSGAAGNEDFRREHGRLGTRCFKTVL